MVTVVVRDDRVLDRERRDRLDRRLDLVAERGELGVHHDEAVAADEERDVAALTFQAISLIAEIDGLDLDTVPIRALWLLCVCGSRHDDGRACQCCQCNPLHASTSLTRLNPPRVWPRLALGVERAQQCLN